MWQYITFSYGKYRRRHPFLLNSKKYSLWLRVNMKILYSFKWFYMMWNQFSCSHSWHQHHPYIPLLLQLIPLFPLALWTVNAEFFLPKLTKQASLSVGITWIFLSFAIFIVFTASSRHSWISEPSFAVTSVICICGGNCHLLLPDWHEKKQSATFCCYIM